MTHNGRKTKKPSRTHARTNGAMSHTRTHAHNTTCDYNVVGNSQRILEKGSRVTRFLVRVFFFNSRSIEINEQNADIQTTDRLRNTTCTCTGFVVSEIERYVCTCVLNDTCIKYVPRVKVHFNEYKSTWSR